VDPQWFGAEPPRNGLVSPERPWVEVATPAEASLQDPPVRLTVDPKVAAFWYNPYQGVVRARVPVSISDAKSLAMYNAINGTRLTTIYGVAPEEPAHEGPGPDAAATASASDGPADDSVGPPLPGKK
jgi:hypothetical protein